MPSTRIAVSVLSVALAFVLSPLLPAQEPQPQAAPQAGSPQQPPSQPQAQPPVEPSHQAQPQAQSQTNRKLWIAKFSTDAKAASAVANIQASDAGALKYSNLFDSVKTFETDETQPAETWTLTAKELDFGGGSTATRALVGFGAGRAHITMEYTLIDPDKKVIWTQKITTKPSFWGSGGGFGAVQNQGQAMDEQAQKLTDALTKFFASKQAKTN
jgi:Domain of unknown function (DUF4410)